MLLERAARARWLGGRDEDRLSVRARSMAGILLGLFYDADKMQDTITTWLTALKAAAEARASSER